MFINKRRKHLEATTKNSEATWHSKLLINISAFVIRTVFVLVVVGIILVSIMRGITEHVGRTLNFDLKNSAATNNALLAITIFLVISLIINLIEKIGIDNVDWLEGPHEPKKYTCEDLKEIEILYKSKLKDLQSKT